MANRIDKVKRTVQAPTGEQGNAFRNPVDVRLLAAQHSTLAIVPWDLCYAFGFSIDAVLSLIASYPKKKSSLSGEIRLDFLLMILRFLKIVFHYMSLSSALTIPRISPYCSDCACDVITRYKWRKYWTLRDLNNVEFAAMP